jgi:hypothetical protein
MSGLVFPAGMAEIYGVKVVLTENAMLVKVNHGKLLCHDYN